MIPLNSQFLDSSAQQKKGSGVSILTAEYVIKELQDVVVATTATDGILVDTVVKNVPPITDGDYQFATKVDDIVVDVGMVYHNKQQVDDWQFATKVADIVVDIGLIVHPAHLQEQMPEISSILNGIAVDVGAFEQSPNESYQLSTSLNSIVVDKV